MHGLNEYDFSARWQDAANPGFTTMDPLAEQTPWNSPYAYCSNDPVNRVDPTGMDDHLNNNNLGGATVTGHDPRPDRNNSDATNYSNLWSSDHSNPNGGSPLMGDGSGSDSQSSTSQSSVPVNTDKELKYGESDPDSNYGPDGSYNLYTPNEQGTAFKFMLGVGVILLTAGTDLLPALGSFTIDAVSSPLAIPVGAGFIEGTAKSIFGPDPESSSSMFMNPASDFGMNVAEGGWNFLTIINKNPLPSYP
jgi:hypothetical protein